MQALLVAVACGCKQPYEYSHGRAWCPAVVGRASTDTNHTNINAHAASSPPAPRSPPAALVASFTNVKGAVGRVYGLQDSTGGQMASLHLVDGAVANHYTAVYMTPINMLWEVRAAVSMDLLTW